MSGTTGYGEAVKKAKAAVEGLARVKPRPLAQLAAECHRLAVKRGKYDKGTDGRWWDPAVGAGQIESEVQEWLRETMLSVYGVPNLDEDSEYGDILHTVLSIGARMGYDLDKLLIDAMQRNRERAERGE